MPACSQDFESLVLPDDHDWSRIGLRPGPELHAGHQSRVFRATQNGEAVVVKLTDGRLVDESFTERVEITASLAEMNPSVVGPLSIGSNAVTQFGPWLVVAYPLVVGNAPEVANERDVNQMASTLATLHDSFARIDPTGLPPVAALRDVVAPTSEDGFGRPQLLHGDYSHTNVLRVNGQMRIFDFDDCGYGPVEFEIGNTLYMVLFGTTMTNNPQRYERFRSWFVDAYRSASGLAVNDTALETAIGLRVEALGRWVDDPRSAPIGIRTASPQWRDKLRAFVETNTKR